MWIQNNQYFSKRFPGIVYRYKEVTTNGFILPGLFRPLCETNNKAKLVFFDLNSLERRLRRDMKAKWERTVARRNHRSLSASSTSLIRAAGMQERLILKFNKMKLQRLPGEPLWRALE